MRSETGRVQSTPAVTSSRPGIDGALKTAILVLGMLLLLASIAAAPMLFGALLVLALPFIVILFLVFGLLGRFGLTAGMWGFLAGFAGRGRNNRWQPPTLTFRCDFPSGTREVRLRGFDSGVQLGDHVRVNGAIVRGAVEAARVENVQTGYVMRRHGLITTTLLAVTAAGLALMTLTTVLAAAAGAGS